ncbi:MAG: acetate/propionate family kinase [Candidatus Hydrogenedentes bacterium]|nr:acetate/propionate family kinase [Candidatus Hydrogenedentota bacterium]
MLTINTGSSSLKVAVYDGETPVLKGEVKRIGNPGSRITVADAEGKRLIDRDAAGADHGAALQAVLACLKDQGLGSNLDAAGHRVVYGGTFYSGPRPITPELVANLGEFVPIAPDHLPQAIQAINIIEQTFPGLPQVACFDTAFHRTMPRVAQIFPLPRRVANENIIRYGFHGLSYEYIMRELGSRSHNQAQGRIVIAHLGNGASMAAVSDGKSIDTTMGFTPAGGLMMGTRPGDIDPGVILYLLIEKAMTPSALNELINRQSGLLGISETSEDMRDLLEKEGADPRAAEAVALFCHYARAHVGSLAATLGGLDTLIFTAGIGEYAAPIRQRICQGLEFLGIRLDQDLNNTHAPVISREDSPVTVRVMHTDEDFMIARHTADLIGKSGVSDLALA